MADDVSMDAEATPLISVLIPAFNHERFVERCLDSVLDEPYPAKELVIIDDGSTDGTGDKIADWVARHRGRLPIQYIRRGNKGIVATLNELAVRAHGKFLRPGASDDYLLPGGLHAQMRYLLAHPGKGVVIGDSIVVDQDGKKIYDSGMCDLHGANKRLYRSDDGIRHAIISHWAIGGPVSLIKRSALETVDCWREGLRIDDWDLFLRLAAIDAIGFIDVNVCAYRLHSNNLSKVAHTPTRVLNLLESQRVAIRRETLFEEPYRTLLRAQSHYIGAKISFLERRLWDLVRHMLTFLVLTMVAKAMLPSASTIVEEA